MRIADVAAAAYQRSVLDAFRDVETALVSYANAKIRRDRLASEAAAEAETTDKARLLYEKGAESFLPVLDAERSLYATEDALARIALYKSLGGAMSRR